MKFRFLSSLCVVALLPVLATAAGIDAEMKTSVVFIANYDNENNFLGWGSGFFVDEGIVVTNKHVIEGGDWYRVYATSADFDVDTGCRKNITKSDVKINLDDDVAYMRVFLDCAHGVIRFANDPEVGDPAWVLGYPYRGSVSASMTLFTTSGSVTGTSTLGWMKTDANIDPGNSGGPITNETGVIGVVVAKGVDQNGAFLTSYFIPSSVIEEGLLYANDSRFGYTPQSSHSSRSSSSLLSSSASSRSSSSFTSSSRSSVRSFFSSTPSFPENSFEGRTCARVSRWFDNSPIMKERVNARLLRRFGFTCP